MQEFESQTLVVQGAGKQLAAKLKAYLRPKCHAALLDPAVNTPATVRLNIFQARSPCASVAIPQEALQQVKCAHAAYATCMPLACGSTRLRCLQSTWGCIPPLR